MSSSLKSSSNEKMPEAEFHWIHPFKALRRVLFKDFYRVQCSEEKMTAMSQIISDLLSRLNTDVLCCTNPRYIWSREMLTLQIFERLTFLKEGFKSIMVLQIKRAVLFPICHETSLEGKRFLYPSCCLSRNFCHRLTLITVTVLFQQWITDHAFDYRWAKSWCLHLTAIQKQIRNEQMPAHVWEHPSQKLTSQGWMESISEDRRLFSWTEQQVKVRTRIKATEGGMKTSTHMKPPNPVHVHVTS